MAAIELDTLRRSWRSWVSYEEPKVGPYWLQLVWTFCFSAVLALVFATLGWLFGGARAMGGSGAAALGLYYLKNLFICMVIGYLIHAFYEALIRGFGRARIKSWQPWKRSLLFGGTPIVGVIIGWPIAIMGLGVDIGQWLSAPNGIKAIAGSLLMSVVITYLMHQWFAVRTRELEAERRATEAQLRLLQGQIEPHFLFNTLAGVIGQIDESPPRAKAMLQAFTDYLRASLGGLRRDQGTLQQELDLADSFLRLMQARMEDRLRFRIEAPAEAERIQLPPLLIQPLVENAVLHGLEPSVEGGQVTVRARVEGQQLRIEVHDDGVGPEGAPRAGIRRSGHGVGLTNLRERLRNRWGDDASVSLRATEPGTLAEIVLPLGMNVE